MDINLYPEMNSKIVGILRINDESPTNMYAAALIEHLQSENVVAPEGIWVNFPDVVYSRWENGRLIYNCGTWQEQVFPTEQAARAAKEGDTE